MLLHYWFKSLGVLLENGCFIYLSFRCTGESNIGKALQTIFDENFRSNTFGARVNSSEVGKFLVFVASEKSADYVNEAVQDVSWIHTFLTLIEATFLKALFIVFKKRISCESLIIAQSFKTCFAVLISAPHRPIWTQVDNLIAVSLVENTYSKMITQLTM